MWIIALILGCIAFIIYATYKIFSESFTQRQLRGGAVMEGINVDIDNNKGRYSDYKEKFPELNAGEYQAVVDKCGDKHCDKNVISAIIDMY